MDDDDKYKVKAPKIDDKYKVKAPNLKGHKDFPDYYQQKLKKRIPPIKYRWDWGALPPKEPEEYYHFPVSIVQYTYTGGEECHTQGECLDLVEQAQIRDMERGLPDLQHNFYIGNDGIIYEGVGWFTKSKKQPEFAHLDGKSIDIAYMGNFQDKDPDIKAVKLAKKLTNFLYVNSIISDDYEIVSLKETRKLKAAAMQKNSTSNQSLE